MCHGILASLYLHTIGLYPQDKRNHYTGTSLHKIFSLAPENTLAFAAFALNHLFI